MANEYREFVHGYQDAWGRIPLQKTDGIRTFRVGECLESGAVKIEIITARKATKLLTYKFDYIIQNAEWYLPESKYVNTEFDVVRCVALPRRQWAKALTLNNCYFSPARAAMSIYRDIEAVVRNTATDILDNYGKPYPSYQESFNSVMTGARAGNAFAKKWMLSADKDIEYPVLVYRDTPVGYDDGTKIVCIEESRPLEEIIAKFSNKPIIYKEVA